MIKNKKWTIKNEKWTIIKNNLNNLNENIIIMKKKYIEEKDYILLTKYNEEIIYKECQIKNWKINDNTDSLKIAKK